LSYFEYYLNSRTHLSLEKDSPSRSIQTEKSLRFLKWVACIIVMNAAQPDQGDDPMDAPTAPFVFLGNQFVRITTRSDCANHSRFGEVKTRIRHDREERDAFGGTVFLTTFQFWRRTRVGHISRRSNWRRQRERLWSGPVLG
jgi:hypothetical protein